MLRGRSAALLAAALLAGCGHDPSPAPTPPAPCQGYAFTDGGGVRVFAVQPKIHPDDLVSYESFRGYVERLVDERVRPCLAPDRPNLIAFPEDLGLPAAFLGSRGADARATETSLQAFLALSGPYAPAIDYYKAKWPDLGPAEGLLLGLTDTLWRAFHETARDVSRSTGAHVIASTNVSGAVEESSAPEDLAALRDPDLPGAESVYVAKDRAVYNAAYVFSPDGVVVAVARKPYLVELEESQLTLSYGPLRDVRPVDLGFARIGIFTSKDAWMPDVVDRLEALGAQVFVQPEAFSGWGIEELPGDWLPAVVQQSGWSAVQKHGGFRHAVIPHLVGNLFDLVFDGQSALISDAAPGDERLAYVGQEPAGGFIAVAPWIIEDPGASEPSLSLDARRAALRMAGQAALPGGAGENAYIETVVAADLDPAAPFPETPAAAPGVLGPSAPVAPSAAGEQVRPAIAAGAPGVVLAWQDDRDGRPQIYVTRSADGGQSFDGPAVAGNFDDAWGPALASDGVDAYLAFAALIADNERILVAPISAGSAPWPVAPADPDPPPRPAGDTRNNQWAPAIAVQNGEVAVAWIDFRNYNWDVFLGRSLDGGQTFSPPERIDDGTDAPERLHADPSLIFLPDGSLACAWTDVRLRQTPARARVAFIGPAGALPSEVLGAAPAGASAWRPSLTRLEGGEIVAAWQDFRTGGNDIYLALSEGGAPFGPEGRVDDGGDGPSYQFAPVVAPAGGGRVVAAWEDTRSGRRRIHVAAGAP